MKGNDGRGALRTKRKKHLFTIATIVIVTLTIQVTIYATMHPKTKRRTGKNHDSNIQQSYRQDEHFISLDKYIETRLEKLNPLLQQILNAEFNLVDLSLTRAFNEHDEESYAGIMGHFCPVNFALHKQDPSSVPMFRFLVARSPGCENPQQMDLQPVVKEAKMYDAIIQQHHHQQNAQTQTQPPEEGEGEEEQQQKRQLPKVLDLAGVAFHESRCGSTLVANTLIAMDPLHHRVYSESAPPIFALAHLCENKDNCPKAAQVLRDVIYMMSRSNDDNEERVFFKIQSIGSWYIQTFRTAFPQTPWVYVYRDPVQVMMSHLDIPSKRNANCVKYKKRGRLSPNSPILTIADRYLAAKKANKKIHSTATISSVTTDEFCAFHLASFTETALAQIRDSKGMGNAINYNALPKVMYTTVLPNLWNVPIDAEKISNIEAISSKYSKGMHEEKQKEWKDDGKKKEDRATPAIKKAAEEIMGPSYDGLEALTIQ